MGEVYGWVMSLAGFFLFLSILGNLLPGKKYEKYIRLFSGMVLILLVVQPLTGGLHLEEIIAHFYQAEIFQYEAEDLKRQILDVDRQRQSQVIIQYERAVAEDVGRMAEDMGFLVQECQVDMGKDKEQETFGMVTRVCLRVSDGTELNGDREERRKDEKSKDWEPIEVINPMEAMETVSPVVIGEGAREKESEAAEKEYGERRACPAVERLRGKIASFYSLEEAYVEIQVMER